MKYIEENDTVEQYYCLSRHHDESTPYQWPVFSHVDPHANNSKVEPRILSQVLPQVPRLCSALFGSAYKLVNEMVSDDTPFETSHVKEEKLHYAENEAKTDDQRKRHVRRCKAV